MTTITYIASATTAEEGQVAEPGLSVHPERADLMDAGRDIVLDVADDFGADGLDEPLADALLAEAGWIRTSQWEVSGGQYGASVARA